MFFYHALIVSGPQWLCGYVPAVLVKVGARQHTTVGRYHLLHYTYIKYQRFYGKGGIDNSLVQQNGRIERSRVRLVHIQVAQSFSQEAVKNKR